MKDTKILLVDGNNFFASCEQMINPLLRGKPVCVLSNNDGCVIARSKEAKMLGIKMGVPFFMAKKSFPDAIYLSSNFALYHEISERMMQLLSGYSDKVDVYSIDEAFLDITGMDKIFKLSYYDLITLIKKDIENSIGISVSVGLASSKMLAKLASHKAKKASGIYFIRENLIPYELENIPLEEIWGIGRNLSRSLRQYGIFYAHEILLKDEIFFREKFGKKGVELKYELSGISVLPVTGIQEKPKSIQKTRAFPEFSQDKNYIKAELAIHLHNVCRKLRAFQLHANTIALMLRTKDFRIFYKELKLDKFTDSELILSDKVNDLFNLIYKENIIYRSSGVIVYNLQESKKQQLSLFPDDSDNKSSKAAFVVDRLENKFGRGVISFGYTGVKSIIERHTRKKRTLPF